VIKIISVCLLEKKVLTGLKVRRRRMKKRLDRLVDEKLMKNLD